MDEQLPLFPIDKLAPVPIELDTMHRAFGKRDRYTCGTCAFLIVIGSNDTGGYIYACKQARRLFPWQLSWPACGLYKEQVIEEQ